MPEMCSGGGELLNLIGEEIKVSTVLFCLFPFFSSSYFLKILNAESV